jgi:hypothetical protein
MTIDRATGAVALPNTSPAAGSGNGQVQYRADGGFAADTHFAYNPATRRLSVGTTGSTGAVNAHATGGVPCFHLTAESGSPYLQMQNGGVWQGVAGGNIQFITGSGGAYAFTLRPPSGPNVIGLWIDNNGRARFGTGAPIGQSKLEIDGPARVGAYTVATVPSAPAAGAGAVVFVSDETGGATLAFSNGTDWRRVTDLAVVS